MSTFITFVFLFLPFSTSSEKKIEIRSTKPVIRSLLMPPQLHSIIWVYPSTSEIPNMYQKNLVLQPASMESNEIQASIVYRNTYEKHGINEAFDAIRTQDGDYNPDNLKAELQLLLQPQTVKHYAHKYNPEIHPDCLRYNNNNLNITFCLQDKLYPVETIKQEIDRNKPLIDRLLSDISNLSADHLVDGLTKEEEEKYNNHHDQGREDTLGRYSEDSQDVGGYVCPSEIVYGRPKRAMNTYGLWKIIVNLPEELYTTGQGAGYERYAQTRRIEYCHRPGRPCSYLSPYVSSLCVQKNNFIRLMAYTYTEGLHVDTFKFPVACSCYVK